MKLSQDGAVELSGSRFTVTYAIRGSLDEAQDTARNICIEQTVEFPAAYLPVSDFWSRMVGIVERFESVSADHHLATISYAAETVDGDWLQLLNVIYGNISMIRGIRVHDFSLPDAMLRCFGGPRFGVAGLRSLMGVYDRPLLCAALKPMGLSAQDYAQMAYEYALGGMDFVKDDHGLTDQSFARFDERVKRCAEAVKQANAKTGEQAVYAPNLPGPVDRMVDRAYAAKEAGAGGLLVIPALIGWDMVRLLSSLPDLGLPILCHPSFHGIYFTADTGGFSARTLYGKIVRLAGADVSIFPNFIGRFSATKADCLEVLEAVTADMGHIKPIFLSPGGGVTLDSIPLLRDTYGQDVVYLMGGGLHAGPSLIDSCKHFRSLVEPKAEGA